MNLSDIHHNKTKNQIDSRRGGNSQKTVVIKARVRVRVKGGRHGSD